MSGTDRTIPWYLAGCGAIGTLFAAELRAAGIDVRIPRAALRDPTAANRLHRTLLRPHGEQRLSLPIDEGAGTGPVTQLLVTTKAHAVLPVLDNMAALLAPDARVVILCNGMGFEEEAVALLPGVTLLRGVTTHGALRSSEERVQHTGIGETAVGPLGGDASEPAWFRGGLGRLPGWHWVPDIVPKLWEKLAVNAVINPLTASHGVSNGALLDDPLRRREFDQLCDEIGSILAAAGQRENARMLRQRAATILASTADNASSTLQDLSAGRRTEIRYINAFLDRLARSHGVEAPLNHALACRFP